MTWGGDVAKMLSRLVLNPRALKESFTLATSENRTWEEIADYYGDIIGLRYITVDTDQYLALLDPGGSSDVKYQLLYDRCYHRMVDNSKILSVTGLEQGDLSPLKSALERELLALPKDTKWRKTAVNDRMDAFLRGQGVT